MSSLNLAQIFPQLKDKQDHYFSEQQIQSMPYFKQLSILLPQKDFSSQIKKSKRLFRLLSIKKGTIIYTNSSQSNCGYFLCHGYVKLLVKKNNRQKLQTYHKHVLHQNDQRVKFLNQQYGIPVSKCELLMNQFYQEKVLFKYLEYQQIYGQGYFGISDMVKNMSRPYMAIATQDTILLQMERSHFDSTLKQLEIKKQEVILKSLLENFNSSSTQNAMTSTFPSIGQQLGVKLSSVFSQFVLRCYEKDEKIFKENSPCHNIYFILKGQVQLSKTFALQIPKKMIKDENKPHVGKQIQVKVSRLAEKCYLGEVEHFLHSRQRQFTAIAIQNNTIVLQIQPYIFMKIAFQFATVERDLIISAKQKLSIASQNFFKQKSKVTKLFLQQFENIENKKKEKILNSFLNDEDGQQNNMLSQANSTMFEVFSKEGVYFRDTYQRLEGFGEYEQAQANNKRAAIRKYKVESSYLKGNTEQKDYGHQFSKYPSVSIGRDLPQDFEPFSSKEKLLNSPKKNISIFELIGSSTMTPQPNNNRKQSFSNQQQGSVKKITSKRKINNFNHLQKDEAVFKRVLIKNGRYQQDKSTYKQHIIKPIVHPKFDDIVKQCMGRKNQVIRKAIGQNRQDLVKDTYQNFVGQLKNKSLTVSKFSSHGYGTTCKGAEEFRKKLDIFSRQNRKSDYHSAIRNRVEMQEETLKDCIGVNQPPKSSYKKNRSELIKQVNENQNFMVTDKIQSTTLYTGFGKRASSHVNLNSGSKTATNGFGVKRNSTQKLILLNHMMKPITYSSVQY